MRAIEYQAGVVLWRPVTLLEAGKGEVTMDPLADDFFEDGEQGQKICRAAARTDGQYIWEPVITGIEEKGMVIFIEPPVPENFTHLEVKALTRSGNALFTKVPEPFELSAYLAFRRDMAMKVRDGRGLELKEKAEIAKRIIVPGNWSKRIVYAKRGEWTRGRWEPAQVVIENFQKEASDESPSRLDSGD